MRYRQVQFVKELGKTQSYSADIKWRGQIKRIAWPWKEMAKSMPIGEGHAKDKTPHVTSQGPQRNLVILLTNIIFSSGKFISNILGTLEIKI